MGNFEKLVPYLQILLGKDTRGSIWGGEFIYCSIPLTWPAQALPARVVATVVRIGLGHKFRVDNIVVSLGTTGLLEVTCVPSVGRDGPALLDLHISR